MLAGYNKNHIKNHSQEHQKRHIFSHFPQSTLCNLNMFFKASSKTSRRFANSLQFLLLMIDCSLFKIAISVIVNIAWRYVFRGFWLFFIWRNNVFFIFSQKCICGCFLPMLNIFSPYFKYSFSFLDTNVDALIQRNSIPNNIRYQRPINMSSSPHTSGKYKNNFTNCKNVNVSSTSYRKVASCELDHVSIDEKSKLTASEDTQIEDATISLPSSSKCSHSNNDICCCRHGYRRFEPPPAYSPLKEVSLA